MDSTINVQSAMGTLHCLTVRGPRNYQALLTRRPTLSRFSIRCVALLEWVVPPVLELRMGSLLSRLRALSTVSSPENL